MSSSYLIEVMGNTFVEAASGGHSHGIVHVNNITFVPYHFKVSAHAATTSRDVS